MTTRVVFSRLMPVFALALVAAPLLLAPTVAPAQYADDGAAPEGAATTLTQEEINSEALRLSIKYMSPYCPGANLRDCTSGKAAVLREEIRSWVAEGKTEAWITDELVSRYGESILSAPRFKGFNMLVWIFPVLAVLIGLGMIFAYLQRQHRVALDQKVPVTEVPDEDVPNDPDLERRLESELSARSR